MPSRRAHLAECRVPERHLPGVAGGGAFITAIATSEDLHIERRDAHQLDTIVRKIPVENPDRAMLMSISFLEAYATSYRYGTPTGRVPATPLADHLDQALDRIAALTESLRAHFRVSPDAGGTALQTMPRR